MPDSESSIVSFVVPTKDSGRTMEACLRSLRDQSGGDVEVIVVDNSSSDSTPEISSKLADTFITGGPERSAQRNRGAKESKGEFVVFIDSDMVLEAGVADEIRRAFADQRLHALVIPERVVGVGFWDRCRQLEKEAYLGDPAVEAARAFRKSTFDEAGGYDESLTGPEDWELPDRLRSLGYGIGRIDSFALHDERTLGLLWAFQKKRYYGKSFSRFLRAGSGTKGRFMRHSLIRPLTRLLKDPLHVTGLYILKLFEGAGLLIGLAEGRIKDHDR